MHSPVTLVVGDANADLGATVHRFPFEGDDALVDTLGWSSGGAAVNCAAALARLGGTTRLLSRIGSDPAAEVALRAVHAAAVDCSLVQIDTQHPTGICFVVVSPGAERTMFSFRGANAHLVVPTQPDPLAGIAWLHICGHALVEGTQRATILELLAAATEHRRPVSLDLCLPLLRSHTGTIAQLFAQIGVLFLNEVELHECMPGMSEAAAAARLAAQIPIVVVKLGPRGCLVAAGETLEHIAPFEVAAVDATGCGDAFVAGFLYGRQLGLNLRDTATIANAVGALVAQRPGAADAMPPRSDVIAFLRAGGRHELADRIQQPAV
ncbi:MAG TPA: carbohydrate kinase family protein [Roseiflexaceae bacterium]|nr:carbohydrate kinase family protein [Roseiflexaceae bacterium]